MLNLNDIFGSELKVADQPRQAHRQYSGFAGAHGLTAMAMGSRGKVITITGTLRAAGATYNIARATIKVIIDTIEAYQWAYAATYTYRGGTYPNAVFAKFDLEKKKGKTYTWTGSVITCKFSINLICLI